jgi:hypothetical protein
MSPPSVGACKSHPRSFIRSCTYFLCYELIVICYFIVSSSKSPVQTDGSPLSSTSEPNGTADRTFLPLPSSPYQPLPLASSSSSSSSSTATFTYPTSPVSLPGVPMPNIITSPIRAPRSSSAAASAAASLASSTHTTPHHHHHHSSAATPAPSSAAHAAMIRAIIQRTPRRTQAELLLVEQHS